MARVIPRSINLVLNNLDDYLNDAPVVEVVVVGVLVEVGEGHAVQLGVSQRVDQVGFEALCVIVVLVERILEQ